jgi:hypothetical protein
MEGGLHTMIWMLRLMYEPFHFWCYQLQLFMVGMAGILRKEGLTPCTELPGNERSLGVGVCQSGDCTVMYCARVDSTSVYKTCTLYQTLFSVVFLFTAIP